MDTDFDFMNLAIILGGISISLIGVMYAGSMLWPEQAERAKPFISLVITGIVLIAIGAGIIEALSK
jgi:hypothetical protein